MTPILVTGGAGFIGSHTSKLLARSGFQPVIIDNLSTGHPWAVQDNTLLVADLSQRRTLADVMREYRIEAVIHFAASAYVGESMSDPRKYLHNNVTNTLSLLDAMLDAGVNKIVFSSSCATYGVVRALPVDESHPQEPCSPYGDSKMFVERTLGWYERAYGLRSVCLRYFNAAGADPEGELGEEHHPETHLIPLALMAALGRRSRFDIYGSDYQTPDGTAVRDFIHVRDLAQAHLLACQYLLAGRQSCALNLGSGRGHSVRNIIDAVERVTGSHVPVARRPRREGDPPELVADASRAAKVLGWKAEHSDLRPIVESACRWFSSDFSRRLGQDRHAAGRERAAARGAA